MHFATMLEKSEYSLNSTKSFLLGYSGELQGIHQNFWRIQDNYWQAKFQMNHKTLP